MPRNKKNKGGGGGNAAPPKLSSKDPIPLKAPETPAPALATEDNESLKTRLAEAKDRLTRVEAVIETIGAQRQSTDAAIAEASQKLQNIGAIGDSATAIEVISAQSNTDEPNTGTAKKNKKHNKHKIHNLIPPEGSPAAPVPKLDVQPSTPKPTPVQPSSADPEICADKIESQSCKNKKKNKKNKQQPTEDSCPATPSVVDTIVVEKVFEILPSSIKPTSDALPTPQAGLTVDSKDDQPSSGDSKKNKNKNKNKNKQNKDDLIKSQNENPIKIVTKPEDHRPEPDEILPRDTVNAINAIQSLQQDLDQAVQHAVENCAIHAEQEKAKVASIETPSKKKNKNKNNKNESVTKDIVDPLVEDAKISSNKPMESLSIIQECPLQSPKLVQSVTTCNVADIDAKAITEQSSPSVEKSEEKILASPILEDPKELQTKGEDIKKAAENIWKILDPPADVAVIEGVVKNKKNNKKVVEPKSELSENPQVLDNEDHSLGSKIKEKEIIDVKIKPTEQTNPLALDHDNMAKKVLIESDIKPPSEPILEEPIDPKSIVKTVKEEEKKVIETKSNSDKKQAKNCGKLTTITSIEKHLDTNTVEKPKTMSDDTSKKADLFTPKSTEVTSEATPKPIVETKIESQISLENEVSTSYLVKTAKTCKARLEPDQQINLPTKSNTNPIVKSDTIPEKNIVDSICVVGQAASKPIEKHVADIEYTAKPKEKANIKNLEKTQQSAEFKADDKAKIKTTEKDNKKNAAKTDKLSDIKHKKDNAANLPYVKTSSTEAKSTPPSVPLQYASKLTVEQAIHVQLFDTSKDLVKDETKTTISSQPHLPSKTTKVKEDSVKSTLKCQSNDEKVTKDPVKKPTPNVLVTPKTNPSIESPAKETAVTQPIAAPVNKEAVPISENKKSPTPAQTEIKPNTTCPTIAPPPLVEIPLASPSSKHESVKPITADEPSSKKDAKQKTAKIKSKAPQPPRTEESPAPSESSLSSASTIVEVGASSGSVVDENAPILTDSKNVQRSASVRSVDVAAVKSPTTESLHINEKSVEAAILYITPVTDAEREAKNISPTTNKRNKNETNLKQVNGDVEAKTQELPEKSAQKKHDAAPTTEVLLMDILEPKMVTGTKPGVVAGNVRVKTTTTPKKVVTAKKEHISKDTGAIPKTAAAANEKKVSPQPSVSPIVTAKKQGSPKPEISGMPKSVEKAPSPKRDMALKQGSPKPETKSSSQKTETAKTDIKSTSTPKTTGNKSPTIVTKNTKPSVKPTVPPRPNNLVSSPPTQPKIASSPSASSSNASTPSPNLYDDEEYIEYKFSPRPVFMSTICQTCKVPLQSFVHCKQCMMISYCTVEHLQEDEPSHQPLCASIQEIAKKRGGHIYNNARILNDDDYRSLRVHTLNLCENSLKRHLQPFEREILLFPRLCSSGPCREWRQHLLTECKVCGQVSYCTENPEHLSESHKKWCQAFSLYQKLVVTQKHYGRIEPSLPSKIMSKEYQLTPTIDETFRNLYKNYGAIKDECTYSALTQLATAPLTAFYGIQLAAQPIGDRFTIHLIGAELQFEADTLDKWETFFLHLVPQLVELRIVFVGPELNAENLPLEILSRIRMCRACRQNCRAVKFDFQCGTLYHSYVKGKAFTKPDMVCFFNPGLYRSTGFNGQDTWPETIQAAMSVNAPVLVTSYTEVEAPRDLDRLQKESGRTLEILKAPHINPFSSQRPERNFISDEVAPMIFKNYYCFVCK